MKTYAVSCTSDVAEKMWDFSMMHQMNISFEKVRASSQMGGNGSRLYYYEILMDEDIACLFVLTVSPRSCTTIE